MDTAKDKPIDPLEITTEFLTRSAQRASVYICYGRSDEKAARQFCDEFESRGTPCWLSARDVTQKNAWPQCIVEAIDSCKFFVLLLTPEGQNSTEIIPEVSEAVARGRTILVMQSFRHLLNPQLEELLIGSHLVKVNENLSALDIDATWSKIVEIESTQTQQEISSAEQSSKPGVRGTTKSFLLQLDCLRGKVRGKTSYQLAPGDKLVLGRSEEADIFVDDARASRRHAGLVLVRDPKYGLELQLMDLMSRNGTWVRYRRDGDADISKFLEHAQTRVDNGAIIRIGSTDIRVTALAIPANAAPVEI
ncbi:MAG: pSer/pThr/pTyr-binding forkhead associated (FHA) protein [Gammaproteobacteria bacterium]|jgi:pSer/pThr/pTyr-binding forkhead associated (FHA) protein